MILITHPDADRELEEALDYYERERPGLGSEFLEEYVQAIHTIVQVPERWPLEESVPPELNVHRYRFHRFPYAVIYQIRLRDAMVISVMHVRRQPGYWSDRIE